MENTSALIDALPYVDAGYDTPGVKEAVRALIEDEMSKFQPRDYLQSFPPLNLTTFLTERMAVEAKRMDEGRPMERINFEKDVTIPVGNKRIDPEAWEKCYNRIAALHNHYTNRMANLQLQSEYGPELWKRFIPSIERQLNQLDTELSSVRQSIQRINWERKNSQLEAGARLTDLENQWASLIAKNIEIERSCLEMEHLISQHEERQQQESQTKENGGGDATERNSDAQEITSGVEAVHIDTTSVQNADESMSS